MKLNISFYKTRSDIASIVEECENLAYTQHVFNGGTLRYRGLARYSDYLVCARDEKEKLVGFTALKGGYYRDNDIYISQIAVDKDLLRRGIASEMIKYIMNNSKGFNHLTADVRKDNVASNALFKSLNCCRKSRTDASSDLYVFDLRKIADRKPFQESTQRKSL